ncbi:MAG: PQQ-dependent sugar dehydrogenase [Bacteroidia bacterium]
MRSKYALHTFVIYIMFISGKILSQTFLPGFSQVKVASLDQATAMRFAPDGRLFVCQRGGTVMVIKNGTVLSTPFVTLTVDQNGERGISGIAFDPNFNTNKYVYIYYSCTTPSIHNRLSRFTANGDVALAGSEHVLLDAEPVTDVFHNGGGLAFGPDGKLYLSMGEDNKPSNAQNLGTYKGKLLRMNSDGSAPADNPYSSSTSEITKKIWCLGLRNPYTLAIQPGTGKIFINNVGSDYWEEVHDGTVKNKNFGWPAVEGFGTDPAYTNPVFAYPHDSVGQHGCAITGGTFFNPTSTNYPASYTGKYFYMDYCNGWLYYLTLGSQVTNTKFATGLYTKNLALQVGPDGNLYYLNRDGTRAGVYKIIYSNNNSPVITSQPASQSITQGQPVTFSVSSSGATPLNYQWKKNGSAISGATSSIYSINSVQQSDAGQYSVVVSNNYGTATSSNATLTVTAFNSSPHASITKPTAGTYYHAGDTIKFSGTATDAEDGTLPASAFEWTVEFHHNNNHFHPGPAIPPGVKSGYFVIPNTGEPSSIVYYRLKLQVTDSYGLIDTAQVDVLPLTSTVSIDTDPSELQFTFDSQPKAAPFSTLTVEGLHIPIGVVSPQNKNGQTYVFDHWQQGGAASQTIIVGAGDSSYTAVYKDTAMACSASGTILREYWAGVTGSSLSDVPVNSPPTRTSQLTIFEGPTEDGDYYGSRIRGYICPPASGSYVFWIASDNNSELWLSTNSLPENKVRIAYVSLNTGSREWTKYRTQQSAAINLIAGKKYYIEAIHREGIQGDNLAVGWKLPNGTLERPIPGSRLSPFIVSGSAPTVNITSPANNDVFTSPSNITIKADATSGGSGIAKVEFYEGTVKLGEDLTSPYNYTWMNVAAGNYVLKAVVTDNAGNHATSATVNISVSTCPTATITPAGPTTMCSGSVVLKTTVGSGYVYQWRKNSVDISGATSANYTVTSTGDYQVKIINGSCISWSAPLHVTIQNGLKATITAGGPTTICPGGNVKLYGSTCSGYIYQWIKNGTDINGATSSNYTVTSAGNYQLRVTQGTASDWSAQLSVTMANCMGKNENDYDTLQLPASDAKTLSTADPSRTFQMKVFPNPNTGMFTITLNLTFAKPEKVKMTMLNILGQPIYNREFISSSDYIREVVELDPSLPTGIYTLQVMIGEKVENTSVVLSKN